MLVVGIFLIPASSAVIPYIFRPTINPFDYIDVKFEGINGEGTATVELIQTNGHVKSLEDLCVSISKTYQLSENEVIVISTNHFEATCWHNPTSKEYVVKGLELFLSDLNSMDENAEKIIHQKSQQIIEKTTDNISQHSTPKHEKFYLLSDGDKKNVLYDVFSFEWELMEGNTETVYLVAYYTDIIVHNGDNATFSYEECMYTGDLLYKGSYSNGFVYGFGSLEDIEIDLKTNRSPDMVLTEK